MSEPGAGTSIGQYEILSIIGQGSTGTVYRAVDTDTGRTVAIKRLGALPSDAQRAAFRREADALRTLQHPSVLRVVELIDTDDHLALVTEYCSGGSVKDALRTNGPFSPERTVAVLGPVASALAAAHRDGIVHRDVKPSNIVLRDDGTPVVADFGLALTDPGVSQTSTSALGSAAYLDPEVADGAIASPSSDLYSLGVVAYELLTGNAPFAGETPLTVLRAADKGEHVALDPNQFGPLAAEVERAMARHPEDRFPDAESLLHAWSTAVDADASSPTADSRQTLLHRDDVRVDGRVDGRQNLDAPAPSGRLRQTAAATSANLGDGPTDRTTAFNVNRPPSLYAADPVAPSRNWRRIGGIAAALTTVALAGLALVTARADRTTEGATGVVPFRVTCDPETTAQCVGTVSRTPEGIMVTFVKDDQPTQFTVGRRTDAMRVSNFFCGTAETLAVYRPSNGVVYYFKDWPLPGEQSDVLADATGLLNAQVVVGDQNNDGCGDIGLELDGTRTWFLPSVQSERLQPVSAGETDASLSSAKPEA